MLKIAAEDLREVRAQLNAWRVVRDALFRRNERAVWLPHLKRRYRQAFRDGVCVAELLVAIRYRLREPSGEDSRWLERVRVRWRQRRGIRITSFIAGDPALIKKVLKEPHGQWWAAIASKGALGPLPWARTRDRVRRLPWQRSTASWQAAYNTACLYAALADATLTDAALAKAALADMAAGRTPKEALKHLENRPEALAKAALADMAAGCTPEEALKHLENRVEALERRAIVSLRRAVDNPRSELERPSDWIDSDPDFGAMRRNSSIFKDFDKFRLDQTRQDYPASFIEGKCPVPHTTPDRIPAVPLVYLVLALDPDRTRESRPT